MSLYKQYRTDTLKEVSGFNYELAHAPNEDGTFPTFTLAYSGGTNPEYNKVLNDLIRPHERARAMGLLSNEVAEKIMLQTFCRAVLKGWKNVFDENGQELPFNVANAEKLMVDLPHLYEELREQAAKLSNYRSETLEQEGNVSLTS